MLHNSFHMYKRHHQFFLLLTATAAASSSTNVLLRCSSASALFGSSHLEIATGLLERPDVLNALIEAEFADNAPVMVPLCWSTAEWSRAELDELQWPPLVAAAAKRTAELRSLAEQHARDSYRAFGRFKGASALLVALELAHCHAMSTSDAKDTLWLIPERARYQRSAPIGASLELDSDTGDLNFVGELRDTSPTSRLPPPAQTSPNPLLFFLGDGNDPDAAPLFSISSGVKSNDQLLLTEGWADEELACDRFEMPPEVLFAAATEVWSREPSKASSLDAVAERQQVLDGLRARGALPSSGSYGDVVSAGGYASEALLISARALSLSGGDFESLGGVSGCVAALGETERGAPPEVEERARRLIAHTCEELLRNFPTTAEEDAQMLEVAIGEDSGQLSDHRRLQCLRSRVSRKRCLQSLLDEMRR